MLNSAKRSTWIMYLSNFLIYGYTGLYFCFMQLYLASQTGDSSAGIGILLSIGQGMAILAPLFWGIRADRAKRKKNVLLVMIAGATVSYCAIAFSSHYLWLAVSIACTMFFLSAFGSILDVIGMETASNYHVRYGRMRLMGMLGYGFVAFGLSFLIRDNIRVIFPVCAVFGVLCCICVRLMPNIKGHAHDKKIRQYSFFKDKNLLFLVLLLATGQFAYGYYLNFFPNYLTEELMAPSWIWGANVLLTTLSEIPFFLRYEALFSKWKLRKILFTVLAGTVLRYLLLAVFTQEIAFLIIGAATGVVSVSLLYCANYYVNSHMDPAVKSSAQTFVYAAGLGVPRMLSGILGGLMTDLFGTRLSLVFCAAVTAAGLLLYAACGRKRFVQL